jgi:enterochelin esterase family protein
MPMPGDTETAFYANDPAIAHGAITTALYPWTGSSQPGQPSGQQRLHIYTPPNYDPSGATKYPVLYLNHGAGNDDSNWSCYSGGTPPTSGTATDCGAAGFIADNLIAAGKAVPVIIIMPYSSDCSVTNPPTSSDFACSPKYKTAIVPYVESNYPVIVDRHYRAMAGLSMGGFLTMATCLPNLATFGSCFAYSAGYQQSAFQSAAGITPLLSDPSGTNGLLDVPFYNAIGTADVVVQPSTADAVDMVLTNAGIKTFKVRTPLGHVWQNWRRYLWQTLQLEFKNTNGCR